MMDRWVHTRVGRCIPAPLVGWMDGRMDRVMEMQAHTRGGRGRPGSQWVPAHRLAGHGHPWRWMPWVPSLARGSCCGRSPPRAGPAGPWELRQGLSWCRRCHPRQSPWLVAVSQP